MSKIVAPAIATSPTRAHWLREALDQLCDNEIEPDESQACPAEVCVGRKWVGRHHSYDIRIVATLLRLVDALPNDAGDLIDRIFDPFCITIIETGSAELVEPTEEVLSKGLFAAMRQRHPHLPRCVVVTPEGSRWGNKSGSRDFNKRAHGVLLDDTPVVFVVETARQLPEVIRSATTLRIALAPFSAEMISELYQITHRIKQQSFSRWFANQLPPTSKLAHVSTENVLAAVRRPESLQCIKMLADYTEARNVEGNAQALEMVKGLGAAREALEQIADDMLAWKAGELSWAKIQHGVLLYGPPGTGKTFCAARLAERIGATLIAASYAEWQRHGHMGDMLAAMHKAFREAETHAPAVLFIDEIDSFGDRLTASGDNADYIRNVINALLEKLDGISSVEGVLIVAACNHPDHLDAALKRSGRFDLKIRLPLPSRRVLAEILQAHAGPDLPVAELQTIASDLVGQSGADVAALVRDARSRARRRGRALSSEDLRDAAYAMVSPITRSDLWRSAVHEAGHALAGARLGKGTPERAEIGAAGGQVIFKGISRYPTLQDLEAEIACALAGRVAEELFLGAPSAGAGGPEGSDLEVATRHAISIDAMYGLGSTGLAWQPVDGASLPVLLADPGNAERVEKRLTAAATRVREILQQNRDTLKSIAHSLVEHRQLERSDLGGLLHSADRTEAEAPTSLVVGRHSDDLPEHGSITSGSP